MGLLAIRHNGALNANPPVATHNLTVHGSDWLWAVEACYVLALLIVVGLTYFARQGEKIFHYLFTISLFVGTIAYFAMASDLGGVPVLAIDHLSSPGTRQIFYAKYINWFVGWTPIIIALGLISGVSWATIAYNVALSWTWVASWLSGAMTSASNYKWGFFAYGLFAYFLLAASLLTTGVITAKRLGISKQYLILASYLSFLWLLYPIAFGLDDGGNLISVTHGMVFFGILDLLTGPVLLLAFLGLSLKWDYKTLNVYFTQYGRVAQAGGEFPEKAASAPAPVPETPVVQDV